MEQPEWYRCIEANDLAGLQCHVTRDNVNELVHNKWTPFFMAHAVRDRRPLVLWLLCIGARASGVNPNDGTAIWGTFGREPAAFITALVRAGADVNASCTTRDNFSLLDCAHDSGRHELCATLLMNGAHVRNNKGHEMLTQRRSRCAAIARLLLGLRAHRHTVLSSIDKRLLNVIVREHLWPTCLDDEWETE